MFDKVNNGHLDILHCELWLLWSYLHGPSTRRE